MTPGRLEWRPSGTQWATDYDKANNNHPDFPQSRRTRDTVAQMLARSRQLGTVWDLGANTGRFSRLLRQHGRFTVSFDSDPAAVQSNYADVVKNGETDCLFAFDLSNPSLVLGWVQRPKDQRCGTAVRRKEFCLGLLYYLAISNHLSFSQISSSSRASVGISSLNSRRHSDPMVEGLMSGGSKFCPLSTG